MVAMPLVHIVIPIILLNIFRIILLGFLSDNLIIKVLIRLLA